MDAPKHFKRLELVLQVLAAKLYVWKRTTAASSEQVVIDGVEFSRTQYLKPAGKADYVEGNANGDFADSGRGDYSLVLLDAGTILEGTTLDLYQEITKRIPMMTLIGRAAQFRIRSTQGRIKVNAITPNASEGQRRAGVLI